MFGLPLDIRTTVLHIQLEGLPLKHLWINDMALKPGPKPIADSTGKPDQRRRDNKNTPGNTPGLKLFWSNSIGHLILRQYGQ
jgi:hypothetical protein